MEGNGHRGIVSTETNVSPEVFRNLIEILDLETIGSSLRMDSGSGKRRPYIRPGNDKRSK